VDIVNEREPIAHPQVVICVQILSAILVRPAPSSDVEPTILSLDMSQGFEPVLALVAREAVHVFLTKKDILVHFLELHDRSMHLIQNLLEGLKVLGEQQEVGIKSGDLDVS